MGGILQISGRKVRRLALALVPCALAAGGVMPASAQSIWDTTISNTSWYVPTDQLLAYASPNTSFSNPLAIGDQTLWTLGASVNGSFTGTSEAHLAIGPIQTTQISAIQGLVTPSGQITMLFTPNGGGPTTVGLGQMVQVNGVTAMAMQMITGDTLLVTHWAYMLPYDPNTFTPPPAAPILANSVPQWAWAVGTPWTIVSPAVFGSNQAGRIIITNYQNGYFWGRGIGPSGENFTLLGSITPEGKVLLATLSNATLTTLYGDVIGNASAAQMLLEDYNMSTAVFSGNASSLFLIAPYADAVAAANNRSALEAAKVLYGIAGTSLGLDGAMAPAITALNALSGPALSTAISQTLPVLAGSAARATNEVQRSFRHLIETRLDDPRTLEPSHRFWMRPFGGSVRQHDQDGAPGYRASGGGISAGLDRTIVSGLSFGGAVALATHSVSGTNDAVPNTLNITSYQAGLYGSYALAPDLAARFQLDAAFNRNRENRAILFLNASATAHYNSASLHAGVGLRKIIAVTPGLTLTPSLDLDYAQVSTEAYSESVAEALNLNVDRQTYRELIMSAGLKASQRIGEIDLIAKAGIGYNALNRQSTITASYAGGGDSFITYGLDVSPWLYSAGLGLVGTPKDGLDLGLHYDVQATSSGLVGHFASLVVKMKL